MSKASDIVVLDLETARSAEDCVHCGEAKEDHAHNDDCYGEYIRSGGVVSKTYTPISWNNKPALGLSIGGYYSYADDRVHWFDEHNLEETMADLVNSRALMVSFNGITFDFVLMRGILRRRAETIRGTGVDDLLVDLCDRFKELAANSYDILAEIWKADPSRKFERGLNSLDAIAQANGLGPKLSHGAQAPRDWAAGRHADVINYCQDDILKTRALFELIQRREGWLLRGDGSDLAIRWITPGGEWADPSSIPS